MATLEMNGYCLHAPLCSGTLCSCIQDKADMHASDMLDMSAVGLARVPFKVWEVKVRDRARWQLGLG